MAYPTATLAYSSIAKAVSTATLSSAMASVPAPEALLEELGCFISADSMGTAGQIVTRTVVIKAEAPSPATVTVARQGGASGSPLATASVTAAGSGYVRAPVCLVEEGTPTLVEFLSTRGQGGRLQAYLKLVAGTATQLAQGAGYSASTICGLVGGLPGGLNRITQARPGFGAVSPLLWTGTTGCGVRETDPPANGALNTLGCVRAIFVKAQGIGYNPATSKVVALGDPPIAGGRRAFAFATFDGKGRVIAITVVDPGCGYITTPKFAVLDTSQAGRGAVLTTNMMRGHSAAITPTVMGGLVTAITVTDPGDGYVTMPSLVIFDPTGGGSGAIYTVGPVPGTASLFGVSRVDVLARGEGYVSPRVVVEDLFTAAGLVAVSEGQQNQLIGTFSNLMKTALENIVGTAVTESLS